MHSSLPAKIVLLTITGWLTITDMALASGGVFCTSRDNVAEFEVAMGRLPIYAPLSASARLGEKSWATDPRNGETPLGGSQGMWEGNRLAIDYTDGNTENIIISLRVDSSQEETEDGYAGLLKFHGSGEITVFCSFG